MLLVEIALWHVQNSLSGQELLLQSCRTYVYLTHHPQMCVFVLTASNKSTSRIMVKKNANKNKTSSNNNNAAGNGDGVMVDPVRVRFQHARIRPFFSGCGRRVEETLQEIREGKMKPSDLPPIQVLIGPIEEKTGLQWYFSLNNRRLWVLKRCREEGLLPNNQIYVRVRKPKSEQEARRYTVENCALDAKIIPEKPRLDEGDKGTGDVACAARIGKDPIIKHLSTKPALSADATEEHGSTDDDSDNERLGSANRFSALF